MIQAIVATSGNPTAGQWADANGNPVAALLALQNSSGAFRYDAATPEDNAFATYQAVPALLSRSFPLEDIAILLPAPAPAPAPGPVELPNTSQPSKPLVPALVLIGCAGLALGAGLRRRAV